MEKNGERVGGGQQLRVIRRCCEKMAVAGCVFDLNRGNFSAITKFIGTARSPDTTARPTRDFFITIALDPARSAEE